MGNKRKTGMQALQQAKKDETMKLPINKFLNELTEEGEVKYSMASKIRTHYLVNPDGVMNAMRFSNSLLHEVRWHKAQAALYLDQFNSEEPVKVVDKNGRVMSKEECYTAHIKELQVIHTVLEKLRNHLINNLSVTVDEKLFTYEMFNEFVEKTDKLVAEIGYELFPDKVVLLEPM